MSRVCVLVQPSTGMCHRELGTRPVPGRKGAQWKESNKHMLYLRDIEQSKSYHVSVSRSLGRKRKKCGSSRGVVPEPSGSLRSTVRFFSLDTLSMVL